jgi:hypothetical protein
VIREDLPERTEHLVFEEPGIEVVGVRLAA